MNDMYNYSVTKKTTLAAGPEVITIQQPATASRNVHFHGVEIESPTADCAVTVELNGTAATATTLAVDKSVANSPAAKATGWSGSDVGTGTVVRRFLVPAGGLRGLDLSEFWLLGDGTAKNLSVRTASITGDVYITVTFGENSPD